MGEGFSAEIYRVLKDIIYRHSGIYLSPKEAGVIESRVGRRLQALGLESYARYVDLLLGAAGPDEIPALLDAVTVNYTSFFRDPAHFQRLTGEVLPEILARTTAGDPAPVRLWSAGCSSGEEPFSLAMCCAEELGGTAHHNLRILATDINRKVLGIARRAVYPADRLAGVPHNLAVKYLVRDAETPDGHLRIGPEVRRLVRFRRFNVLHDAPALRARLDVVFCRNVMMYFDQGTQSRLLANLARYLKPGGFLFIGDSDRAHPAPAGLTRLCVSVYRKPPGRP